MSKRRIWFYWAVLTGYFTADFFLARGHIFLALVLPLLPVIVIGSIVGSIYNEMTVYLSERHPEAWNRIALEKVNSFRGGPSLLFLDRGIGDPVYKKLRNQYKRIRFIQIFFGFIGFILFIYSIDTVVRR